MIYDYKRGFEVGKIYAMKEEKIIYKNGSKKIIGEGTPVKIIKIEHHLITVQTAYDDTFTFKEGFSPIWDKALNKSILNPLSTLKQLLVKLSYKTNGVAIWSFVFFLGLFIAPATFESFSPNHSVQMSSLLFMTPAFFMMFAVRICAEYSDCVDEETDTVINLQNRKELKILFNENSCEIFSTTEEIERKVA